jgi:hypothetical protein
MKKITCILAVFAVVTVFRLTAAVGVDRKTFTLTAEVPPATSISMDASWVDTETGIWTDVGTSLDFGTLRFFREIGGEEVNAFFPNHYYAIDIAPEGGGGSPTTVLNYTEGSNPNAVRGRNGLGHKTVITFIKATFVPGDDPDEAAIATHGEGGKMILADLSGETVTPAETDGGWLRVYIGITSNDPIADIPDPGGAELFTAADEPGVYDGTLRVTSTLP